MRHCRKLLLAASLTLSAVLAMAAQPPMQVPPELIQQLFDLHEPNAHVPKRPFDLGELEALVASRRFSADDAAELTRRYLAITYPAGTVGLSQVFASPLPDAAKQALLAAGAQSLTLSGFTDMVTLVRDTPADLRAVLIASPQLPSPDKVEVDPLLALNASDFAGNAFYQSYVSMRDETGRAYLLSTPRKETHLLWALLEPLKAKPLTYGFVAEGCDGRICRSRRSGDNRAEFTFAEFDAAYVTAGRPADVRCTFDGIYRRDYRNRQEVVFQFDDCALLAVEGRPPARDALLESLRKVQP